MIRSAVAAGIIVAGLCGVMGGEESAMPSSKVPAEHLQQYSDMAVTWMQEYLRVDTTNPPGTEMKAAAFYKKILDDKTIYPDQATLAKLFVITARDPATQRVINRMWTRVKTGR